ncbi:hypothetical protein HUT29_07055 [Pseudomonas chlororaphis]|uniref:YmfL family putative regulatory protein n=1 Tax=Pseudomonas chlororaphis TaxID=587753 RepID=UPI001B30ADD5|nr:YmfL family putative regulatory protein [Pseudomonas chlororaphis]QTT81054.1 hypothetical protein HUT29_07055 [Pseudomonas chlororaphis]
MKAKILNTRRDMTRAVINAFPGGRIAAAAVLGLTLKQFDNHAYENSERRPLSDVQLHQLEQQAGTTYFPEYVARLYGGMFVRMAHTEQLDNVELYTMSVRVSTHRGAVDLAISRALDDGSIDQAEADEILFKHNRHLASRHAEVLSAIALYSKRKSVQGTV